MSQLMFLLLSLAITGESSKAYRNDLIPGLSKTAQNAYDLTKAELQGAYREGTIDFRGGENLVQYFTVVLQNTNQEQRERFFGDAEDYLRQSQMRGFVSDLIEGFLQIARQPNRTVPELAHQLYDIGTAIHLEEQKEIPPRRSFWQWLFGTGKRGKKAFADESQNINGLFYGVYQDAPKQDVPVSDTKQIASSFNTLLSAKNSSVSNIGTAAASVVQAVVSQAKGLNDNAFNGTALINTGQAIANNVLSKISGGSNGTDLISKANDAAQNALTKLENGGVGKLISGVSGLVSLVSGGKSTSDDNSGQSSGNVLQKYGAAALKTVDAVTSLVSALKNKPGGGGGGGGIIGTLGALFG